MIISIGWWRECMIIQQQQSLCNSVILSIREGQVPGEPTHQLLPLAVAPTTLHHWWPTSSFRKHVPPPPHNQRTLSYQWHRNQFPNWGINSVWFNTLLKRLLAGFLSQPLCMICKWPKSNAWYVTRINQWPTNCIVSTICINWLFCIHLYTELCHFPSTNYDHHSQWTLVATC